MAKNPRLKTCHWSVPGRIRVRVLGGGHYFMTPEDFAEELASGRDRIERVEEEAR